MHSDANQRELGNDADAFRTRLSTPFAADRAFVTSKTRLGRIAKHDDDSAHGRTGENGRRFGGLYLRKYWDDYLAFETHGYAAGEWTAEEARYGG